MRRFAFSFALALLFAATLHAQAPQWQTSACPAAEQESNSSGWSWWNNHQEHACEMRSIVLPLTGDRMDVASTNGAVHIVGEDRKDVALTVRVTTDDSSKEAAEKLARQVKIITEGTIHDEGPSDWGFFFRSGYSASYTLHVPRHFSSEVKVSNGSVNVEQVEGTLRLAATNGSITVQESSGDVQAHTVNGKITLKDISGEVQAHTVNGSIHANVSGDQRPGSSFSAKTVNGAITLGVPENYSAHLTAKTVNGGISVNFPITVQGSIDHNLDTNLGQGGPAIELKTVNGRISVSH